jgi:hypothetical protein
MVEVVSSVPPVELGKDRFPEAMLLPGEGFMQLGESVQMRRTVRFRFGKADDTYVSIELEEPTGEEMDVVLKTVGAWLFRD